MVYQSPVFPTQDDTNISIPQFMTRYNPDEVSANKVVHTDLFSKQPITYGSLRDQAARGAWGLRKRGLKPGNVLLALVNNSNDFVLLAHATWWTGAIFAPLNISATLDDISHILQIVKPTHVATIAPKLDLVKAALASNSMTKIKIMTVLSKIDSFPQFPDDVISKGAAETLPPYDLQGKSSKDVTSTICFSSGTTGRIKGVQLSHHNLIVNAITMRISMPDRVNSTVREVFFAPYCHIYGLTISVLAGMWVGALYCGLPAFDLETFCQKSSELKVTDLHLVPPVALAMAVSPVAHKYDLPSLKRIVISAAPLKKAVQLLLKKRLPHTSVCQGYGLSECTGGIIHQIDEDNLASGSVGKLFAGVEARLVDPKTGADARPGEEGELWVRGAVVMQGYIGDKAATEQTFSDGWLRTGDILKIDDQQNFWVTDRLKEMIKYKGFQIPPSELEDLLLRHPDVIDAAVCAVYDDAQATEVPLAYVSLSADKVEIPDNEKQKILDSIRSWTDNQLAGYKKLRGGVFHLQTLPKTPTGKILRRLLPAKLKEEREAKL
ncbi:putative amp dependent CoA ligase [Talaromyces proteolyticus]|uniref:Amp dependent CoA ligase n=1 Tax=Talaromyces proteolyticus TaxID=1131652 RepID=A0AAD4Q2E4_9EURO|nr:putative amp dependent CoA ligase [Talaromyces proteolyticus]KAH8700357.1 putative amp dependent CoA ligase [Talaromyces proteolyticus]